MKTLQLIYATYTATPVILKVLFCSLHCRNPTKDTSRECATMHEAKHHQEQLTLSLQRWPREHHQLSRHSYSTKPRVVLCSCFVFYFVRCLVRKVQSHKKSIQERLCGVLLLLLRLNQMTGSQKTYTAQCVSVPGNIPIPYQARKNHCFYTTVLHSPIPPMEK